VNKSEFFRKDDESPMAIEKWGWKYHHLGIPVKKSFPGEYYIPDLKIYVAGFESSPFGIQWMRFEEECPIDDLIKNLPHIAFEVENIEEALACDDFEILSEINSPSDGVRVIMIKHNGAPIELIEFKKYI
jgi:hypothetical protein